ncbi:MAG: ATP synthase F1 subunit epsilon [Saprospiraceae bacterium]|uniref:ATP synthase F1 subunit epsilon n=1 Tax=Candidatus Opimibacter skivensis TaxID=2982028 RepID=A0A9D7SZ76_9BACT|nr:ATP synthase F1 subunit epsilon [Candidatus Opimibacter skivensis]
MHLVVLTPDKELFQGTVTSVNVPAIGGRFEVLQNHAPIVAALEKGEVRLKLSKGETKSIRIENGFIEVLRNEISLLVTGVIEE